MTSVSCSHGPRKKIDEYNIMYRVTIVNLESLTEAPPFKRHVLPFASHVASAILLLLQ